MATKLIGVSKMKVNEIIAEGLYDASPFAQKMARYGRIISQMGEGDGAAGSLKKQKGEDDQAYDDRLRGMNQMSAVGSALGEVGSYGVTDPTPTGKNPDGKQDLAKMFADIEKKTGVDKAGVMKLINIADKMSDVKSKVPDPEPTDQDDDDFDREPNDREPSDDELARQADDAARG
jgi:hypothetical protein